MALNSGKKDIFGLSSLVPPTADENKQDDKVPQDAFAARNKNTDSINSIISNDSKISNNSKVNNTSNDSIDSKVDSPKKSSTVSKKKVKDRDLYTARARFYDEDDKEFLKYYGGNLGFSQEEFLNYILENAFKNKDKDIFDPKDDDHNDFRKNNLLYYSTVRLPERIKKDILKEASKHRLSQEQYLGYMVRKERFNTPGWF